MTLSKANPRGRDDMELTPDSPTPQWLISANEVADKMSAGMDKCAREIGSYLQQGKDACGHAEYEAWVERDGRFSLTAAGEFLRIFNSKVLPAVSDPTKLPISPSARAVFARAPIEHLNARIQSGEIHPNMSREDARKIDRKIKVEGQRKAKGLPPEPTEAEKAGNKAKAIERKEKAIEKQRLLQSISDEDMEALGPIAEWEGDLVKYAKFQREYQLKILGLASTGGYNRLSAVIRALDSEEGEVRSWAGGDDINLRILPVWVKLEDCLTPLISSLRKTATVWSRSGKQMVDLIAAHKHMTPDDPMLAGICKLLTQAKAAEFEELAKLLETKIPADQCSKCEGFGTTDSEEGLCSGCQGRGWINRAEKAKINS